MRLRFGVSSHASGFILLEFLIALAFFSIAMLGALAAQQHALSTTREVLVRGEVRRLTQSLATHGGYDLLVPDELQASLEQATDGPVSLLVIDKAERAASLRYAPEVVVCGSRNGVIGTLSLAWGGEYQATPCESGLDQLRLLKVLL